MRSFKTVIQINLALRTQERCSLSHATSFNRTNVTLFFNNLKDVFSISNQRKDVSK